ncbi:translation initiation factor IF-2 [Thioflexithrix psekupsensis]|uniref:Translation initiation factor IF-2 n=1 Tax=Thioflexithrix psekupsensis TaxID=1570016 RepID=A0A251XAW6_9GAMM|nr:translation initiation factor IF-2 [Thioflexithrix psekupsensis]OUD15307.1 translation initiation factor IF-2 [Thioflexithrix psekupsensis]
MAQVTVKQFAETVGIPIERLLSQLGDAGLPTKAADDNINDQEKLQLLTHLRQSHGKSNTDVAAGDPSKITLQRKTHSEIRVPGSQGKTKTVNVEVRKKRTFVKRPSRAEEERQQQEEKNRLEAAQREAEAMLARQQEEAARQAAVEAEKAAKATEATKDSKPVKPEAKANEAIASERTAPASSSPKTSEKTERSERDRSDRPRSQGKPAPKTQGSHAHSNKDNPAPKDAKDSREPRESKDAKESKPPRESRDNRDSRAPSPAAKKPEKTEATPAAAPAAAKRAPKPVTTRLLDEEDDDIAALGDKKLNKGVRPKKTTTTPRAAGGKVGAGAAKDSKAASPRERDDRGNKFDRQEVQGGGRNRKRTRRAKPVEQQHGFTKPTAPIVREVALPETITVGDLAQKMSVKAAEVIKTMMTMGVMVTINQVIDQETASIVVEEMGHKAKLLNENALEDELAKSHSHDGEQHPRAPVVTIMGHVDHGKTSLLDYIRTAKVVESEAGGITQHIGAYHVELERGSICFLDTPGHEAFTAMRARGAKATDLVILVVAADDGVMPQTLEAIQHAKAAKVPIVVAVNKIDKPGADPERIRQELAGKEVVPEEWGGDTMFVNVSAKTGQGIDNLLEAILLQAEVLELSTTVDGPARGVVIESRLDKGRGAVATLLVQQGTLRKGDILLAGQVFGRVRAMLNEVGKPVESAGPSIPVEVLGLSDIPSAGDEAVVVPDERKAREIALFRQGKFRDVKLARQQAAKLENVFSQMEAGGTANLNIVLKADVNGSVEALADALRKLSNSEVRVNIIASGVGAITESDVNLAVASGAILMGFNVRADSSARRMIEEENVDLHYYSIIFEAINEVKQALSGMLAPEIREEIIGLAEVRDVFRSPKFGAIAGCLVVDGTVKRNNPIRVLRDNVVIYEGELESLRRFKDDVAEVKAGTECGIGVKNYNDVKVGDQIEVYQRTSIARTI